MANKYISQVNTLLLIIKFNNTIVGYCSGACYHVSEESVTATKAAVKCATMTGGGRLASVADLNDIENIKKHTNTGELVKEK